MLPPGIQLLIPPTGYGDEQLVGMVKERFLVMGHKSLDILVLWSVHA
jgi:hypothetical protein